jgi:hypothetical protein
MNQGGLEKLARASSAEELRRAIETLCRPFGNLKDVRLLPNKDRGEYLCFVELNSPHLNPSIIEKLGGIDYGNSVAFRIPFTQAHD